MTKSETETITFNDDVAMIAPRLNAVKEAVSHIQKSGTNTAQNYKYVEEAALVEKVREAMIKEGLVLSPDITGDVQVFTKLGTNANQTLVVFTQNFRLTHTSGAIWPWPVSVVAAGQDTGDKHVWKASTGAHKYALMRLLQLATGDDPEGDETVDVPQPRKPAVAPPRPIPKKRTQQAEKAESTAGLQEYDDNALVTKQMMKEAKIWPAVFSAAERKYGKNEAESHKFECLDEFLQTLGYTSANQLRVKNIPSLLRFASDWPNAPVVLNDDEIPTWIDDDEVF